MKSDTLSRLFPVPAQDRLQALCGPHHRFLQVLETAFREGQTQLDVTDGGIRITGPEPVVSMTETALAAFSRRLSQGAEPLESELAAAIAEARMPERVAGSSIRGLKKPVTPQTAGQAGYIDILNSDTPLIFGVGPAGTGKTFLAVAAGVADLIGGARERLIVARPAVEAGEKLGFLPGDLEEKVDPYMLPVWDSLRDLMGQAEMERRRARMEIEVAPLAFMRGRTLKNAFIIIDEAQNATIAQMKMLLTRLGRGSRMVVTGDPSQTDLPGHQTSGLAHALRLLAGVTGVEQVRLTGKDVVRHDLVGRIVDAYEADEARLKGEA